MEGLKVSNLVVGTEVGVKEPSEHFSHTCFIFRGIVGDVAKMECKNNDDMDGEIIDFPLSLLAESYVWEI